MFATLRTEDRHGEVVCISSTNQLPQPGQNQNHFACDGCRAKKLKCTGHRFGCQRCRERNLGCTYSNTSQPRRRKVERPSASHNSTSNDVPIPSSLRGRPVTLPSPAEEAKVTTLAQTAISTSSEDVGPEQLLSPAHTERNRESQVAESLNQEPGLIGSDQAFGPQSCDLPSITNPDFHDLDLPDYLESELLEFDMDNLLEADPSLSEEEGQAFELGSAFTTRASTEDKAAFRKSSIATTNSLLDDVRWNSFEPSTRKRASEHYPQKFVPMKRPSSAISSQRLNPTAPLPFHRETNIPAVDIWTAMSAHHARGSSFSPTETHLKSTMPCRCVGVTLTLLEKVQSHGKATSFCTAEKLLQSLKRSISQCQAISNCSSCRNPSRVMAFSILLVEKIMGFLEDVASVWETNIWDWGTDGNGNGNGRVPIHLGQYQIDTVQERCEVFGFLILIQVRNLSSFLERLRLHAEEKKWESQQNPLRSLTLRMRELQDALGGIPGSS